MAMNVFIEKLINKLQENGVQTLLVKGQGVAQCYERPLWRTSGDIDLLFPEKDYQKSKEIMSILANSECDEVIYKLHKTYNCGEWKVELHGKFSSRLLNSIDGLIDEVQLSMFERKQFRMWTNGQTDVDLPSADNDVILIFTHILQHFFIEGVGLRQICDWCRLLWTFNKDLDVELLEYRLRKAHLKTEWKAFSSFAVEMLGTPPDMIPFFSSKNTWKKKGVKIKEYIIRTGNFGSNRNIGKTYKYPVLVRKMISCLRHTKDGLFFIRIFPVDALRIWFEMILNGVGSVIKRE